MKKETYKIKGISCASCVLTIEKVLKKTPGVHSASVNFASESALIDFDENTVSENELAKAVSSAGYELEVNKSASDVKDDKQGTQTISMKVIGMDSPHCAMVVENAIKKLDGIENVDVDFANKRASVIYNSSLVSSEKILQVITDAGYKPIEEHDSRDEIVDKEKVEQDKQIKTLKKKLIVGGIISLIILLGSFAKWFSFLSLPEILSNSWVLFALATPVQFWVGWQFYSGIKLMIKYRTADMNSLVAIGTLSAYLYSVAITIFPAFFTQGGIRPETYFDTSSIVIVLILLGKYFEASMKGRASQAIKKLVGLQPKTAKVMRNNQETTIPISEVQIGDFIIVKPGEKIPVDGEITEGESEIDESMVTGESIPVHKIIGDIVIGSTINKFGSFTFKATKIGKDTVLSQIIKMVEDAQGSKARIQRLADLIASYFVPVVIVIAILTFIVWIIFGPSPAFNFALINFVAVLIIACPCALGLATPMAIMVSSGTASKKGILIKDAVSLETANRINTVVLDKTGTITEGKPQLTDIVAFNNFSKEDVLGFATSLEKRSEHPLGQAILQHVAKAKQSHSNKLDKNGNKQEYYKEILVYELTSFEAISGKGVKGLLKIKSQQVETYLGNKELMDSLKIDVSPYKEQIQKLEEEAKTVMILANKQVVLGLIAVADTIKKEAVQAVQALKDSGLEVWLITGDNDQSAQAIARQANIQNVMSRIVPDKKAEQIKKLQEQGKVVAMVGDGINDAPALTQADIGIAMSGGTDIAMESANITLMRGDLMLIPETIKISKRTMKIIKENLFWAFFYNSAFIPIAAGILYPFFGILLSPIFAAVAMSFSSISVVSNSLRLKKIRS